MDKRTRDKLHLAYRYEEGEKDHNCKSRYSAINGLVIISIQPTVLTLNHKYFNFLLCDGI